MTKDSHHRPLTSRRIAALLLFSLQLASATASSSCSSLAPASRLAFYPRGRGSSGPTSSSASSTRVATRRQKSSATKSAIQTVGFRRKSKQAPDLEEEYDCNYDPQPQSYREPTLEELRAQLGPIGLLVSNTVELVVVTAGSCISGGCLGYFGGGLMGIPSTIFGKDIGGMAQRFSAWHARAFASCKSWAQLSAAFSGFHQLVNMLRGGVDDGWTSVFGSGLAGAYLNRAGGVQAMIQGGATYAGFTYFLAKFFPSSGQEQKTQELSYTDVPLD